MYRLYLLHLLLFLFVSTAYGQSIGINTPNPDGTTQLHISSLNKGILPPRVALSDRNSTAPILNAAGNPASIADMPDGLLVYNTATAGTAPNDVLPGFYFWLKQLNQWMPFELKGIDDAWYKENTASTPTTINDNIYTLGDVGIGTNAPTASLDVNGSIRIRGGAPERGKMLTATDADGNAIWATPKLDYAPYGYPSYYWDGALHSCDLSSAALIGGGSAVLTYYGGVTQNSSSYCGGTGWNYKKMIEFNNTTAEAQTNNAPPAAGVYVTVKATAGMHNNLLLSTIDGDRWSTISTWLCDANGNNCVKLLRSTNNTNGSGEASTYTLGPFNNVKETAYHGWLNFPVTQTQVATYIDNGYLQFLITRAPNNNNQYMYLSGVACVPNPVGYIQHTALMLHYGMNGNASGEITWNSGSWNNEALCHVPANTTQSVHVKVMDPTKDVIVTFHGHSDNWHGGCPFVTIGNDPTIFRPIRGIMCAATMMYKDKQYMTPQSFIIPASIVQAQITTTNSGVSNVIRLNIRNTGASNYHLRGIDTEIYK